MNHGNRWALVTGGGSGIGRALALNLAERGLTVLVCGRREAPLHALARESGGKIRVQCAGVHLAEGRQSIAEAIPPTAQLTHVVHNAAVLEPIGPLRGVSLAAWRHHQATNVEGPLFLTQLLLAKMAADSRILHISSGAAHKAYFGWGPYCTAKAALYMLTAVWQEELATSGILVGSARPGVVDTPMQAAIRKAPENAFPQRERFQQLKTSNALTTPEQAAQFLAWLMLDTGNQEFLAREWDLREVPPARYGWKESPR